MLKIFCTSWLLLAVIFGIELQAQQPKLDSLDQVLSQYTAEDTTRAMMLIDASETAFGRDFQQALAYAEEGLQLAHSLDYSKGIAYASLMAGRSCIYLSKMDQGLRFLSEAKEIFRTLSDTSGLADATRAEGIIILNLAKYNEAIALFEEGARLSRIAGDLAEEAFCVMDIGIAYIYLSGREKALEYFLEALKIAEKSQDKNAIGNVKNSIGQIYYEQLKYMETKQMMEEALELALDIDNPILISDCYFYLARVSMHDRRFNAALELNSRSLTIDSLQGNLRGLAHKHVLNGDIYLADNQLGMASSSYDIARQFTERLQDKEQTLALVLIRLGKAAIQNGRTQQAIAFLNEAVAVAQQGQLLYWEYEAYENLSQAYAQLGDYQQAYDLHQKYAQVKDSVVTSDRDKNFNQLQAQYEDEKKKAEIDRLSNESIIQQQQIDLQQSEAAQKAQQTALLLAVLLAVIVIAVVLWVLFRNKTRSNEQLALQNEKIEQQNEQKEILLKEIHHRVKNNLQVISSLLSLQSHNIQDQTALSAVKEGQNRVKSIALIHQKLYQHEDISRVDFYEYVTELIHHLRATFRTTSEVDIIVNTHDLTLDIDTAVPLGLIVNELVSNSFKYAFEGKEEGKISIELSSADESEERLLMSVADDGIGIPSEVDIDQTDSLGLKLVRMLCTQLDGDMTYSNGNGSRFDLTLSNTSLRKVAE
ncbi:MAG: histidine kinase dimerization/phosphoacceptor domain -containing protein [Cytophagales bacterium]|nr:histidine kinase dimerization/phosphoacceptor domain -containing protein [Cytophagales bacterium]